MIGSFFLLEADNIEDVARFNVNDPFARIGFWQSVSIYAFDKRVDDQIENAARYGQLLQSRP